jgi:hypothetical protein
MSYLCWEFDWKSARLLLGQWLNLLSRESQKLVAYICLSDWRFCALESGVTKVWGTKLTWREDIFAWSKGYPSMIKRVFCVALIFYRVSCDFVGFWVTQYSVSSKGLTNSICQSWCWRNWPQYLSNGCFTFKVRTDNVPTYQALGAFFSEVHQ